MQGVDTAIAYSRDMGSAPARIDSHGNGQQHYIEMVFGHQAHPVLLTRFLMLVLKPDLKLANVYIRILNINNLRTYLVLDKK